MNDHEASSSNPSQGQDADMMEKKPATKSAVQQGPCMPRKLYEAAIKGDEQILIEMLGLEKEDGGDIIVPIKPPAESDTGSLAQSEHVNNLRSVTFMGNTVLHVLCAYDHAVLASKVCNKDEILLRACNKLGETPLHYAAKGIMNEKAMDVLIEFARSKGEGILKEVLRDRNNHGETALHVAATYCNRAVEWALDKTPEPTIKTMMDSDRDWEDQVDNNGLSSVDLCIARGGDYIRLLMDICISDTLKIISRIRCSGVNQPTPLHANLSSAEIAQGLTQKSTPAGISSSSHIHVAASLGRWSSIHYMLSLDASLAYLQDSDGLYPVHVAARKGEFWTLLRFMRNCPDCGELVDHHERNFLHIAAEENRSYIFSELLLKLSDHYLSPFWGNIIKRMMCTSDKKGNTPMHIASEKGNKSLLKIIYNWQRKSKELGSHSVRNRKGLSAFDISVIEVESRANNSVEIEYSIAKYRHRQYNFSNFSNAWFDDIMPIAEGNDSSMMDQLQIIGLGAVLITTVAFAVAFTLPGGYNSNGSPLLAGKYLFKAFILAITSAFLQSFFCVLMLMIGGLSSIDRPGKSVFLSIAMYLFSGGARSMVLSFGLGLYLVLAPVHKGVSILILLLAFGSVMLDITPSVLQFIIEAIHWVGQAKEDLKFLATELRIMIYQKIKLRIMIFLGMLRFILPFVFIFILALLP